jgi:hypothetical protein
LALLTPGGGFMVATLQAAVLISRIKGRRVRVFMACSSVKEPAWRRPLA